MHFDDLLLVGDVVPVTVGFPAVGDDLYKNSPGGRFWNVRNTALISLDVDFGFFVFDKMLFESLDVDASVFDRFVGVAARHFDRQTRDGRGRWGFGRRSFVLLGLGEKRKERVQEESHQQKNTEEFHDAPGNMFA